MAILGARTPIRLNSASPAPRLVVPRTTCRVFTEGTRHHAERRREHGIGPEHRCPRHGDGYRHGRHADLHPGRDGCRHLRHRLVQRPAPDQRRARLRDERQLCGDGFGLRRQRRRGQHQRDHQRHGCGRSQLRAPVFTEGTSTTRSVAEENTASDDNIGTAVTATDADTSDTLTYTLGGTDASSFDIEPNSGQIKKKSGVTYNYEAKPSYAVTVSVSDGNGGADSINVTINVTSDRAALIALYNATDGDNWTNNTNWLSNEPLSSWYGVNTTIYGRVTRLYLPENHVERDDPGRAGGPGQTPGAVA